MAIQEYKLSYTAKDIDEKLTKVGEIPATYETKSDASNKLKEAKEYVDDKLSGLDLTGDYDTKGSAEAVQTNLDNHTKNADIHFSAEERAKLSGITAGANAYTHPNSGVTAGTYKSVTVDAQGHVTGGTNPNTLAGYGITDAEAKGTADSKVSSHNTSDSAHNDIRTLISDLKTTLNNFLDVDDATTDQLSEVLTLINNNKGTLESLTTSKVNVSDIINNLTTNNSSKLLSAAQGVVIKALIDALQSELDSHTHEIADVSGLQTALDGKAPSSHGEHVFFSTALPVMDGTAAVGTATTVSRTDHKHPTDTSRAAQTDVDNINDSLANTVLPKYMTSNINTAGWYRIAKLQCSNAGEAKGGYPINMDLTIMHGFANALPESHSINIAILTSKTNFSNEISVSGNDFVITKIRHAYDNTTFESYIEVYYSQSLANPVTCILNNQVRNTRHDMYELIIPVLTTETADNITVVTTHEFSANKSYESELQNYLPLSGGEMTGGLQVPNIGTTGYYPYVGGGSYRSTNGNETGFIKIKLPQSWVDTMVKFTVSIYNYAENSSVDYIISGYLYNNGASARWTRNTAVAIGNPTYDTFTNLPIIFGHDGSTCCVYIGTSTKVWYYPQIQVKDVIVGFTAYRFDNYNDGWSISIISTSDNTVPEVKIENTNPLHNKATLGDANAYFKGILLDDSPNTNAYIYNDGNDGILFKFVDMNGQVQYVNIIDLLNNIHATNSKLSLSGGNLTGKVLCHSCSKTNAVEEAYAAGAFEIREVGLVGSSQTDMAYAPKLGFHWAGVAGGAIALGSDGRFYSLSTNFGQNIMLDSSMFTVSGDTLILNWL